MRTLVRIHEPAHHMDVCAPCRSRELQLRLLFALRAQRVRRGRSRTCVGFEQTLPDSLADLPSVQVTTEL